MPFSSGMTQVYTPWSSGSRDVPSFSSRVTKLGKEPSPNCWTRNLSVKSNVMSSPAGENHWPMSLSLDAEWQYIFPIC